MYFICYKTTNIQDIGVSLNMTVNKIAIPKNLCYAILKLEQPIPETKKIVPVDISINGKVYPVYTNSGNLLMSDQLVDRKAYLLIYGNNPEHFTIVKCCNIKPTKFTPPTLEEEDL